MKTSSRYQLRALTEGAIFIAMAQILSYLKLYELPNGGSVTVAMLPVFIYCVRWGFSRGMLASFVYSVLQLMFDGAYAWGWQSMIGDYIVAYTVLGFAGIFAGKKHGIYFGAFVGTLARFVVALLVGVWVWGEYMPDTFFGMTMTSPWIYSALYNGSYLVIDFVLIVAVAAILEKSMHKYLYGEDLAKIKEA